MDFKEEITLSELKKETDAFLVDMRDETAFAYGSIPGAVVGAFIIGLCENLIKSTDYTVFSDAFTFALLIVILVFKPTGLFGEKTTDKV